MSVLPDMLRPGLAVVFCGTAVSSASAKASAYYAGPGNKFWPMLGRTGLTPHVLAPREYPRLLEYGIGLTDLAKGAAGGDASLSQSDFDVKAFVEKIALHVPAIVAFNGKTAAKFALGVKQVEYGLQRHPLAKSVVWVLPSTSGAANGAWDEAHWFAIARAVRELRAL